MHTRKSTLLRTSPFVLAALALVACGGGSDSAKGAASPGSGGGDSNGGVVGSPAPEFSVKALAGGKGTTSLKSLRGKVVVVDFWGTFCEPCKKSFPKYQELVEQVPGDVAVLAVSVDEPDNVKKEQLLAFAKENHAKFSIVWDKDHSAAEKYGMRSLTMPSSFVIDKKGVVRHLHVGFKDGEEAKLAEEIKALIK